MRKQNEDEWQQMYIPGEDIPTPTNTPHTITTLGEILTIFEEVCRIQGNINLEIHQIKTGNDKDKWLELKNKTATEVVNAYIDNIYCLFGPSKKILTDNGTEFKNKLWKEVFDLLRIKHRFTPVYSPQCNGKIEGFHKFLKATIGKQMQGSLEWDSMVSKATAAYNFFPTQSSKHAPILSYVWQGSSSKTHDTGIRIT